MIILPAKAKPTFRDANIKIPCLSSYVFTEKKGLI